jgi:hypothetical protein
VVEQVLRDAPSTVRLKVFEKNHSISYLILAKLYNFAFDLRGRSVLSFYANHQHVQQGVNALRFHVQHMEEESRR